MNEKITYTVVSDISGHDTKTVLLPQAAEDIFKLTKTKSMACAIEGEFKEFDTIDELKQLLENAVKYGYSINCFDELIGG